MEPKARYVNRRGEFYQGIPARDLTDDDWSQLSEEQQALLARETNASGHVMYRLRQERRSAATDTPPEADSETRRPSRGKGGE